MARYGNVAPSWMIIRTSLDSMELAVNIEENPKENQDGDHFPVIFCCYSVTDRESLYYLEKILPEISIKMYFFSYYPIGSKYRAYYVLVACKSDLKEERVINSDEGKVLKQHFLNLIRKKLAQANAMYFLETSAKTGDGIQPKTGYERTSEEFATIFKRGLFVKFGGELPRVLSF